jgi:hypothetical protein
MLAHYVDDEAQPPIRLYRVTDTQAKFFYIGKFQFPGPLDFERGITFTIFVGEKWKKCPCCGHYDEKEREPLPGELTPGGQMFIAPMDEAALEEASNIDDDRQGTRLKMGRVTVDLRPFVNSDGEHGYKGYALCPAVIDAAEGVFLTVFTSREGFEELQLSRLDHSRRRSRALPSRYDSRTFPVDEAPGNR